MKKGEFDFGVVRKSAMKEIKSKLNVPEMFSSTKLNYKYKLVVSRNMAGSMRNPVNLKKLQSLPFSILEGPGELKDKLNHLASRKKTTITPLIECSSSTQIWNLITRGHACGFLPEFVVNDQSSHLVKAFDLDGFSYNRDLCIIWDKRKENITDGNVSKVLKILKSHFS